MKKELIITIIIIIAIIIADICTQNYTKSCVHEIDEKLQKIKEESLNEDSDNIKLANDIDEIYQDWVKKSENLSFYLEHDELEKVHSSLRIAKAYFEADEVSNGIPELENCMYILYHIQEKEAFKLKNIF